MKTLIRRNLQLARRKLGVDKSLMLLGGMRAAQNAQVQRFPSLADTEFSVYSQWGEDGIIDFLVSHVPVRDKVFVEIGVEDYQEANTRFLLQHRYWKGLIIDGSAAHMESVRREDLVYKFELRTRAAFVTRENVVDLISEDGFGARAGLLSVDIDGVDYWVLEAIPHVPEIVIVEYNDLLGTLPVSVPYQPDFMRAKAHFSFNYWGANLQAFDHLLSKRGYRFVGSNAAGTNAFFVLSNVAENVVSRLETIVAWPSQMREARDEQGNIVLEDRRKLLHQIAHLPLVRVDTGASITVGDALARSSQDI